MTAVDYAHVSFDEAHVPVLTGTRVKVVEIVLDYLAHGSDAEEIQRQFPTLTLGQIHSALGYYFDHQEEIDRDIARRLRNVEAMRARRGNSPVAGKLKRLKKPQ